MRTTFCLALALAATLAMGCRSQSVTRSSDSVGVTSEAATVTSRLDRGGWMVNQSKRIWRVMQANARLSTAPRHVGYVVERRYRQMRGGPAFEMYSVTSLNRSEQLGHIDNLGRAVRYEPKRNGTFDQVGAGTGTLEQSVGAILQTPERISLEETSVQEIAFATLDTNGNGVLEAAEIADLGGPLANADTNADGVVDLQEFSAVDNL